MASIRLTYLNYKGRAELLRYILAQASVEYEDNRIEPGKWAELMPGKSSNSGSSAAAAMTMKLIYAGSEFGIPVLEIDGNIVKSNKEIAKFLAEKYSKTYDISNCFHEWKD